jgi:hypothetical protein
MIFEEGHKRSDCVVEKYYYEKNLQYISCIGETKLVGKSTQSH